MESCLPSSFLRDELVCFSSSGCIVTEIELLFVKNYNAV